MNPQSGGHTQLRGRRLLIARATWIALVVLIVVLFVAGVPVYYDQLRTVCAQVECTQGQITPENGQVLQQLGLSLAFYAGFYIVHLPLFVS